MCRSANQECGTCSPGQAFAHERSVRGRALPARCHWRPLAQTRPRVQGSAQPLHVTPGRAAGRFPWPCHVPTSIRRKEGDKDEEDEGNRASGTAPPLPALGLAGRRPPIASGERVSLRRGRPSAGLAPAVPGWKL